MDLPIGTVLLGKYRVDAVLGIGGMGAVVRASHLMLAQPVAIKVLLPELAQDHLTVQRFLREAQAAVQLRGEHMARVHDVGTLDDGRPFMVMEYLEGADLNQILRAHGPQTPETVADLMLQACEGIAEAHAIGIIHRDLKPSNFFVTRMTDGEMLLKILDFGISRSNETLDDLTGTQAVVGTPSYMAPEQMRTAKLADARSDQWSIGVVMYQLLTGRVPFEADSYAALVLKAAMEPPAPFHIQLPGGLDAIILRCLDKQPDLRFPNVAELARMLAPYSSDPMAGQRSAERAMRILNVRTSGPSLFGANGELNTPGGATPNPFARSWPRGPGSNPSSVSAGAGQVGQASAGAPKRKRKLLPFAVIGACVALGVGGVLIATHAGGGTTTPAAVPVTPAVAAPAVAAPVAAPAVVIPTIVVDAGAPAIVPDAAAAAIVALDAAAPAISIDAAIPAAVSIDALVAAPDAAPPADAAVAAPAASPDAGTVRKPFANPPTPTPPTKPKHHRKTGDDLFDNRH